MPDLKFDGNFYYSLNTPSLSASTMLLMPTITNPTFASTNTIPGILELIKGDLGITEKILNPVLKPIIKTFLDNPLLKQSIMSKNNLQESEFESYMTNLYIPKDNGLKALEKTIITSMMESHKPVIDFITIFLQSLGIIEDISCRFLGTSIKVLGTEIGFKSRSPFHWDKSLNYTETINSVLSKLLNANNEINKEINKSMSNKNPIKNNVNIKTIQKSNGDTDLPAYYVGYFDEDGNSIDPPKWVKDSNKWLNKKTVNKNGETVIIGAPFKQLSNDLNIGVETLKNMYNIQLENIDIQKNEMLKSIQDRLKSIDSTNIEEINSINLEKTEAEKSFNEVKQSTIDTIYGTNIMGNNFIDDDDKTKGVNPPAILNDFIAKTRTSQLRSKYYPTQQSTIQELVDKNGKAKEPYVFIPTYDITYNGSLYKVEIPFAFDNQINQNKFYNNDNFLGSKKSEFVNGIKKYYSLQNTIKDVGLNPNNETKPFFNNEITHFSNKMKNEYIPDNIKNYYMPLEWEEVLVYDVINKRTNEVIRTETEFVPFKIDVEKDYELRIIKIVNKPLINNGSDNSSLKLYPSATENVFINIYNNNLHFSLYDKTLKSDFKVLDSKKFTNNDYYVDEDFYKKDNYIYIRKNIAWYKHMLDGDDCQYYKIKNINKNWNIENKIGTINNTTKEIILPIGSTIPQHILNYKYENFFINNTYIKIISINNNTLKYDSNYNISNTSFTSYSYLDTTNVEVYQDFEDFGLFNDTTILNILAVNYTPLDIKNSPSIIIDGLNTENYYSVINGKDILKKDGINTSDDIFNITKTDIKFTTKKGIELVMNKLDYKIDSRFNDKSYIENNFPLSIYSIPKNNNTIVNDKSNTETGTVFTNNNNIPSKLDLNNPNNTHSTDDINEDNLLKEGIIYHGLDNRFVDRNKYKTFYLIEALKKNDNDDSAINNKVKKNGVNNSSNSNGNKNGKVWYGLTDKFTVLPMIMSELLPIITSQIIPLSIKTIQTISNPTKIKQLILDIGLMSDASKFGKNFTDYSKENLDKQKKIKNKPLPKNLEEHENREDKDSKIFYNGIQADKPKAKPIFMNDGQALVEFGKSVFGKSIVNIGVKLDGGSLTMINKKEEGVNEQNIFNMILNFVKLPFEIILKIFKYIIDWIKKLLNPAKMASALKEFLSFEWLKKILAKESILSIFGMDLSNIQKNINNLIAEIKNPKIQKMYRDMLKNIRGNNLDYVEVFIYDILVNGKKIGQETETKPYSFTNTNNTSNDNISNEIVNKNPLTNNPFTKQNSYSLIDSALIGLKPFKELESLLVFIQELLNGFLSIPISLLGLEPTIQIPKFGKEIPFANIITGIITNIEKDFKDIELF